MRIACVLGAVVVSILPFAATGQEAPSVERGKHVSIIGGCHDCHTQNYNETAGQIDPELALKGHPVGWQGPWGTTYAANLRITVKDKTEDAFVEYAKTFEVRPPMPWYNVHAMSEGDLRSLYQYIKSLGEPGDPAPEFVPPGEKPSTPYNVVAPPIMPN